MCRPELVGLGFESRTRPNFFGLLAQQLSNIFIINYTCILNRNSSILQWFGRAVLSLWSRVRVPSEGPFFFLFLRSVTCLPGTSLSPLVVVATVYGENKVASCSASSCSQASPSPFAIAHSSVLASLEFSGWVHEIQSNIYYIFQKTCSSSSTMGKFLPRP